MTVMLDVIEADMGELSAIIVFFGFSSGLKNVFALDPWPLFSNHVSVFFSAHFIIFPGIPQ